MWVIKKNNATTGERDKVAAVCLFQHSAIQDKVRLAVNNDAARERYDIVEALCSACEVVGGGDYGSTARRLSLKEVHDLLLRRWVNAGNRLVKEIEEWISRKRSRQEDASSLPTGELTNLATRQIKHVNSLQGIRHRVSINATWATKWAKRRGAPHHHHLID